VPAVSEVGPVVSLDAALMLNERMRLGVIGLFDFGGALPVRDEANNTRGTLTLRGGAVLPHVGVCVDFGLRACGGVQLGARIEEGQASGAFVFKTATLRAAAFTVGPALQLAWVPGPFHLALDASLLITPSPSVFEVVDLLKHTQPVVQGVFRLSLGLGTAR
jgi:hypothetical protein